MKNSNYLRYSVSILLIIGILFNTFFCYIPKAYAATTYVVTEDLNFRSKPTTSKNSDGSSNIIGEIEQGTYVTLLSTDKVKGTGCSAGWYNISYNNMTGYACSLYVQEPYNDNYLRPWNTPKRSIMGGAKWISNGYIAKGQFTSYLKKFNVNPSANNDMFTHQYQTNIAAPSSESSTTYNSYKNNGLLESNFVFNIPVFEGMADYYGRPNGDLATINAIDTVVDSSFENELDSQGFPESYKRILRYLHSIHPNWSFTAMKTGYDFTYSVGVEQTVAATNISALYDSSMELVEGSTWYKPSFSAVAYYMDPRNFLTDKYIFQFESLKYDDKYTEDVVQTVIANTFMKGNSSLDNQSYKSIFVEAGKTYDVSPLYLASLARQEVGTNGNKATTGEVVVYNGVTYSGLYNFFSIGAYSGVSDGIVYASGGYCTTCENYFGDQGSSSSDSGSSVVVPTVEAASTTVNSLGIGLKNNYVRGFGVGADVSTYSNKNSNIRFSDGGVVKTGMTVTFADGSSYTAVVYGDLSGDGVINSADLLKLRQHLLGTSSLSNANLEAAELTGDGTINSADLLRMRQYLLGTSSINQL